MHVPLVLRTYLYPYCTYPEQPRSCHCSTTVHGRVCFCASRALAGSLKSQESRPTTIAASWAFPRTPRLTASSCEEEITCIPTFRYSFNSQGVIDIFKSTAGRYRSIYLNLSAWTEHSLGRGRSHVVRLGNTTIPAAGSSPSTTSYNTVHGLESSVCPLSSLRRRRAATMILLVMYPFVASINTIEAISSGFPRRPMGILLCHRL
ncbi:hypothetical protein C8Q80DRAFT_1209994 [Daedaleopsis nitida]|nr:hypothetical protein C8Q80DRAFT_1209994 [Daedaleopsis nitida]